AAQLSRKFYPILGRCGICQHLFLLFLIVPLAIGPMAIRAEVTPFDAMVERLEDHPAVRKSASIAREWSMSSKGALGLPNPSITIGLNNVPVDDPTNLERYLPSNRSLEFKQAIPNGDVREAQYRTLLARSEVAQLERIQVLAGLKKRLITALAERRRITQSKEALGGQLELISELERWLRGVMEGGNSVYARFDELDVRRGRIEERLVTLEGEDLRWQAELRELLDKIPDQDVLPEIEPRIWTGNPTALIAVQEAQRKLDVARSRVNEKRASLSPDYAFGMAWQQRESGTNFDGEDWLTLKFTVSVPLWADSNQRPKVIAAETAVTSATAERDQRLREVRGKYDDAMADYRTSDKLLRALARRSARLSELEASNRRRYEAGDGSLEDVIRPAIQRTEITLEEAKQHAAQTISAARINALLMENGT
ncbi:MAG: TolC family protein, partial [Candidatus Thiodiazotropha endolucinida]